MDFITVNHLQDSRHVHKSSIGISDKIPGALEIIGILPHATTITFSRKDAAKLVEWLESNILAAYNA